MGGGCGLLAVCAPRQMPVARTSFIPGQSQLRVGTRWPPAAPTRGEACRGLWGCAATGHVRGLPPPLPQPRRVRPWPGGLVWWGHRGVLHCPPCRQPQHRASGLCGLWLRGWRCADPGQGHPRSQPGTGPGPGLRPHGGCRELVSCLCLRCPGKCPLGAVHRQNSDRRGQEQGARRGGSDSPKL